MFFKISLVFILPALIMINTPNIWAKVTPPNYTFKLDDLNIFKPGKALTELEKKHGKGEEIKNNGLVKVYRFKVKHQAYNFPVIVQAKEGKILDFYATLPRYFLHDVFHQSIINRIGKQDQYFNKDEHSIYIWNNKENFRHVYSAACTITCFPIFYSVALTKEQWPPGYKPYINELRVNEQDTMRDVFGQSN
jgi:hypothetical protein